MPVLDASVYVAYLSPAEVHHSKACRLCDSMPAEERFVVPSLFRLEVMAALARRGESQSFLDAVDALTRSPKFEPAEVEPDLLDRAVQVALRARLRAYDALYAALALSRGTSLWTFDGEVAARLRRRFPRLEVITEPPAASRNR